MWFIFRRSRERVCIGDEWPSAAGTSAATGESGGRRGRAGVRWEAMSRAVPEAVPPPDDVPTTGPRDANFACLDVLESCRGVDGKLELRMTWPGTAYKANHWKQISNPYEKRSQGVDGYEAVDCPHTGNGWGGIEAGGANSLINGSATNPQWWWFSLGTYKDWRGGIPGPADDTHSKVVHCAELHVKHAGSWLVVMRQTTGTDFGNGGWWKRDWFRTLPAGVMPLPPPRTFATSNFKHEYAKIGVVPIRRAHQVMAQLDTFLYTFVHAYGITAEADGRLDPFLAALQGQVQAHADGPSNQLLTEVGDTAELLWTSAETFAGMGEFNKQLCSLLNRAIRDDHPDLAASTAAMARSLRELCVIAPRGGAAAPEFPDGGITWRGTGFDDSMRDFFTEGKEYRVPGFLATSFSEAIARRFIYNEATAYGRPGVLWKVHVDPDPSRRCKNVNFVRHSLVAGEQEYLFAAYSVFTIRRVTWSADPTSTPHLIELDAALDNALCSEDLPLAPWY